MRKLLPAVSLDAGMTAFDALVRLARHGLWLSPGHPAAMDYIGRHAARLDLSPDEAARRLQRDPRNFFAAIRRQWNATVVWYSRPVVEVIERCMNAPPDHSLIAALGLHEHDGRPPLPVDAAGEVPEGSGVVLDGDNPVAVSEVLAGAARPARRMDDGESARPPELQVLLYPPLDISPARSGPTGAEAEPAEAEPPEPERPEPATEVHAWPRLDAPDYAPAGKPFEVLVGLAARQQAGVAGGRVRLPAPPGLDTLEVTVELIADGLDAPGGWSQRMRVAVADPAAALVRFTLVGREPPGPEPVHLTTLEVRYVLDGTVCGTASRPLVVGQAAMAALPDYMPLSGTPWLAQPASASAVELRPDPLVADLTIEIAKPDRNDAAGRYVGRLYSPHPIPNPGPFDIDVGQDAKTFARELVDDIRLYGNGPLADNTLRSVGDLVADKLTPAVGDALREVAARVAPRPPAVLIVSAEPYVPWELASVVPPLDPARPACLGAQAVVGRWLRAPAPQGAAGGAPQKPPPQPPGQITVRHMAVMTGRYKAESGLRRLPEAEAEAVALTAAYKAVPLGATPQELADLLNANLVHGARQIGGVEAVHLAGHGDFDPAQPDTAAFFLSDGKPIKSLLFRSARYGGERQPLIFLNACMIGIGGELLGDMGGFPGNCLKGGFGAVLGALWEVDDQVAHDVALEFWRRALPRAGGSAEAVGSILRDLRAKSASAGGAPPVATYLAYVYYGHPRLTLRAAAAAGGTP